MFQKNLKTKYERRIRICFKSNEKENEDKKVATSNFFYWEWLDDSNEYKSYSPYASLILEENYQNLKIKKNKADNILDTFGFKTFSSNKTISNQIEESSIEYIIDLDKMEQANKRSGFSRKVKRELSGYKIFLLEKYNFCI